MDMDMDGLLALLRRFRDERGWRRFHSHKNLAMSVSIEAAELLELFQWVGDDADENQPDINRVADEAADVLIYILILFDSLNLNPIDEALKKIQRNETRFPAAKFYGKPKAD